MFMSHRERKRLFQTSKDNMFKADDYGQVRHKSYLRYIFFYFISSIYLYIRQMSKNNFFYLIIMFLFSAFSKHLKIMCV